MGQNKIFDSNNDPVNAEMIGTIARNTLNGLPLGVTAGGEIVVKTVALDAGGGAASDVNVAQVAGTAITVGAGAVSAGTQRTTLASDDPAVTSLQILDDWDESDRAKVNPIVGQAGVAAGSGTISATTQRVTIATDNIPLVQGTAVDNAAASGNPVQVGGVAVDSATYSPAYTAGDATKIATDKDSGGMLSHIRKLTRTDDAVSADPKQYSNAPSNATIATTDATVFTLAAGEKGFIQNLNTTALAVRRAAGATSSAFHRILKGCTVADDGTGGEIMIEDHIGAVSVAAMSGSPRYIAWKV